MANGLRILTLSVLGLMLMGLTQDAHSAAGPTRDWASVWAGSKGEDTTLTDLAVDTTGNVVVTGVEAGDYVTVKYSGTTGEQLWISRYPAASVSWPERVSVALDPGGNAVVTGPDGTVKYDGATGEEIWVTDTGSRLTAAVVVDAAGDVVVTGYDGTFKYDGASGEDVWSAGEDGFAGHALALDASGNVVVAGYFVEGDFESDYTTAKYDGDTGDELWLVRTGEAEGTTNSARGVVVDSAGDVLVTGYFGGEDLPDSHEPGPASDYVTIKYAGASGKEVWSARYDGPQRGQDVPAGIALDPQDNVIVTGTSDVAGATDYATVKYNGQSGNRVWVDRYDTPPAGGVDSAADIVANAGGDVVVTGSNFGNFITIKYNGATGARTWIATYDSARAAIDEAYGLALDPAGNVVVGGISYHGPYQNPVFATVKYLDPPPPALATFTLTPNTPITGGTKLMGQVTITNPSATKPTRVTFTTSDRRYRAPAAVTVPKGLNTLRRPFTYTTRVVRTPVTYTITATCGGVSRPIEITLNPR